MSSLFTFLLVLALVCAARDQQPEDRAKKPKPNKPKPKPKPKPTTTTKPTTQPQPEHFNPLPSDARQECYDCLAARASVCGRDCFTGDDDKGCFSCVFEHNPGCLPACGFPAASTQFCSKPEFCPKSGSGSCQEPVTGETPVTMTTVGTTGAPGGNGTGMTTVFSQPGEVELTRNNLLATLLTLGKEWEISFQFEPSNYDNSHYTNLIHLTTGGDNYTNPIQILGARTPAIFFKPDLGMLVRTAIGAYPNFAWNINPPPPVGEWSTLTLTQLKSGATTTFSATINGDALFRPVVNPTPLEFSNVKVFASHPFYPAQPGFMKNLVIKTSV